MKSSTEPHQLSASLLNTTNGWRSKIVQFVENFSGLFVLLRQLYGGCYSVNRFYDLCDSKNMQNQVDFRMMKVYDESALSCCPIILDKCTTILVLTPKHPRFIMAATKLAKKCFWELVNLITMSLVSLYLLNRTWFEKKALCWLPDS